MLRSRVRARRSTSLRSFISPAWRYFANLASRLSHPARRSYAGRMTDHVHPTFEHTPQQSIVRRCDVAVIGGSAAGLAAALQLVRQRRSVIVVDDGTPRNAPAAHMHGYLGREGTPPEAMRAIG